jgi:AraC-like DNA-binding protein
MIESLRVSPPTYHGFAIYPPGATYGPRLLKDYEFVWMIEGDAEYTWNQTHVTAPAGSILLCRPGATDFFRWDRTGRTRHGYIHFNIEALPEDWPPPQEWPLVRQMPEDDIVRPLMRHLLTWTQKADPRQSRLAVAYLLSVFVSGQTGTGRIAGATWPQAVERACAFLYHVLEQEPARPIRLADLAAAAHVSPEHLCRLFGATLGYSPIEVVRLARLEYAAGLLARTNYSVTEISALCGFATPYHFSRLFRKAYGQPPTLFREAVLAGLQPPTERLFSFSIGLGFDI